VKQRRHRALIEPVGGLGGTSGRGVGLSRQRTANVSDAIAAQANQASELNGVIPELSTAHAPPLQPEDVARPGLKALSGSVSL
jgi:hypothetical protein